MQIISPHSVQSINKSLKCPSGPLPISGVKSRFKESKCADGGHSLSRDFPVFEFTISAILPHSVQRPNCIDIFLAFLQVNAYNQTHVHGTALRSNGIYVTYYIFWSKFILVEVIPYMTIMILNLRIIGKIWKSSRFRRRFVETEDPEMTSRQKREANLGLVLIAISVIFIFCQSFKIVPDVYEVATCRLDRYQRWARVRMDSRG